MKRGDMRNRGGHGRVDYIENKPQSLAEQLKELNKSPEQKRKEMPEHEWSRELNHFINNSDCQLELYQYVCNKYKLELQDFHKKGSALKSVLLFIQSKQQEFRSI